MHDVIPGWDQLPDLTWAEKVAYLTAQSMKLPQIDTGLTHEFTDKTYIRTVRVPRGTVLVGRIHKLGHEVHLLEGSVLLVTPEGRVIHGAPDAMRSKPGFQMVCYMLTDVVARTLHPNPDDTRDIEALENIYFESPQVTLDLGEQVQRKLLI